jgi:hypothetical protein
VNANAVDETIGRHSSLVNMPFLSTDLYIESEVGLSIEQLAQRHGIHAQEVHERIEAARLFFDVQLIMPDFPLDLMFGDQVKPSGREIYH